MSKKRNEITVDMKNRIRDLREDRDLRQIDVSNATGIDQKTLSNYETGKTNPDSYSIIKLAEFFGVTTDYLLGYSHSNLSSSKDVIEKLTKIEKEISEIKRFLK
ncbi:MAG: helix-turn-helix transcriptional regulator [Ruminococcaceae bacterium]|nr:helix-turn-helix transcriptional regulator [Oscillospiraceae bacterium]